MALLLKEHSLSSERHWGQEGLYRQNWTLIGENAFLGILFQEEVSIGLQRLRTASSLRHTVPPQPQTTEKQDDRPLAHRVAAKRQGSSPSSS